MRKFIIIPVMFLIAFVFTACGSESASSSSSPEPKPKTQSLTGSWSADGFEAEVTDSDIQINFLPDADTKGLYWAGTFETPTNGSVTSSANHELLDASLFGSGDDTKSFSMGDDTISFEFTMMGVTKTIVLKPVK